MLASLSVAPSPPHTHVHDVLFQVTHQASRSEVRKHEGVELAWRLWDLGCHGRYVPDIVVHHPATDPARHDTFYRLNARNRVWVARRNLPGPLVPFNLATWSLITLWRIRDPEALRVTVAGFREGLAGGQGPRQPMSWKTAARLTRAGRPPVF
ncbi:hypothetical protein SLAV_37015 [Streptomyces lavendulae subsp. lavendulae]|uniref:Uncharacterized protein n=1 Tax=Streptomyces lavendulae subsp. lavendulae TaxID=58340 RepID=A0A2K8PRU6_STRLA|nr:hypothetical protein SLAV_37015 [Streptomyces lavendulae subsp. lavendulae]QUQ58984.1 hypothetical protein SLLC_35175 [Streptomyces lavendulae subsp. lavendulae]